jgi:3-oxoacyl-[acyl-carrier protein] reductase
MSEATPRVAIVTGAARGIGCRDGQAAGRRRLRRGRARPRRGATKDTVQEIEAAGGRALGVGADVSDAGQVQAAVDRIADELVPPSCW